MGYKLMPDTPKTVSLQMHLLFDTIKEVNYTTIYNMKLPNILKPINYNLRVSFTADNNMKS